MEHLIRYLWPGNVREMENAFQTAMLMCKKDILLVENFPLFNAQLAVGSLQDVASSHYGYESLLKEVFAPALKNPSVAHDALFFKNMAISFEKFLIKAVLEKTRGNQLRTAEILGISRTTLRLRMTKYGLLGE